MYLNKSDIIHFAALSGTLWSGPPDTSAYHVENCADKVIPLDGTRFATTLQSIDCV